MQKSIEKQDQALEKIAGPEMLSSLYGMLHKVVDLPDPSSTE